MGVKKWYHKQAEKTTQASGFFFFFIIIYLPFAKILTQTFSINFSDPKVWYKKNYTQKSDKTNVFAFSNQGDLYFQGKWCLGELNFQHFWNPPDSQTAMKIKKNRRLSSFFCPFMVPFFHPQLFLYFFYIFFTFIFFGFLDFRNSAQASGFFIIIIFMTVYGVPKMLKVQFPQAPFPLKVQTPLF